MEHRLATFFINPEAWQKFLVICRENNSDASKTLRAFVEKTIKENKIEKERTISRREFLSG